MASSFFSIVIPTHNRANFIAVTLQAVLDQNFTDFEVLVVDDGSKDNTAEVVKAFTDPRIRYFLKDNAERGAARNYGLDRAEGDYVLFLDSDDLLHPNHLLVLYQGIQAATNPPDFIATKYDFARNGQRRPSDISVLTAEYLDFDIFLTGNVLACNICVRRNNPYLFKFEEERCYAAVEDWMFMLQNTQHGGVVQLVDALTLTMSDHDQRSMRADNQGLIRRLELAHDWMQQHLTMTHAQRRKLLGRLYYLCAIHAHIDGCQIQAVCFAGRAIPGLDSSAGLSLLMRCITPPQLIQWIKKILGR